MRRRAVLGLAQAVIAGLPCGGARAAEAPVDPALWRALVSQASDCGSEARIELVNAVVNRWLEPCEEPQRLEWPTPGEALQRGQGDCRAFAILKFFTLLAARQPADDVRVLYTVLQRRATPGLQRPHLVAWARDGVSEPRVLDNLNPFTQPLSLRPDLRPVFSLDTQHLRRGADEAIDRPAAVLRPWREMLERRAREPDQSLVDTSSTRPVRALSSQR